MKALKNILIAAVALVALFIVIGLFLPNTWEVSKSVTMQASKNRIYDSVANLHKWLEWSPWNDSKDASLSYTYEGPEVGLGAQQNWSSDKMGTGWLKITKADVNSGINYDLFIDMGRFQNNLSGEMIFETVDDQTKVTWIDRGNNENNIIKKWMSLSMGSMLGKDMELGLNKLKEIVEKKSEEQAALEVVPAEKVEEAEVAAQN